MGTKNNGARGNWGEAVAAAWLLRQGYELFKGWGNTSCDFIAARDGELIRVEVKIASITKYGRKVVTAVRHGTFDWLLVVTPDGDILLNPDPSEVYGTSGLTKTEAQQKRRSGERATAG